MVEEFNQGKQFYVTVEWLTIKPPYKCAKFILPPRDASLRSSMTAEMVFILTYFSVISY
jgi:hypothetical protein